MPEAARPVLTTRDAAILRGLIGRFGHRADRAIGALLLCARTVLPERIGRDIVTFHSRVAYAIEDAPPDMRIVVPSQTFTVPGMTLPVHTPRGLALLGARAGETVLARHGDGRVEPLQVLAVVYQPEAATRPSRHMADVVAFPARVREGGFAQRPGGGFQ